MLRGLFTALVLIVAWSFLTKEKPAERSPVPREDRLISQVLEAEILERLPTRFECDGRQYCKQMKSRKEAEFFAKNCPNAKMDSDRDGIPCENDSGL